MKLPLFWLLVFLVQLVPLRTTAKPVTLTGKIVQLPPNTLRQFALEIWSDDRFVQKDTIAIANDGSFTKQFDEAEVQARLRVWGQATKWVEFVFPSELSNDRVLDFGTLDYLALDGVPANIPGKESSAYYQLTLAYKQFRQMRDSLGTPDSVQLLKRDRWQKPFEEARNQLNEQCLRTQQQARGTFTGDVLAPLLYVPYPEEYSADAAVNKLSPIEFERTHWLDRLNLSDRRILRHSALIRVLNQYSTRFPKTDSLMLFAYIDRVMNRRKGEEEVDAWLFRFLMMKFVNYKDDVSLSYLLKWYAPGCSADEFKADNATKTLLRALSNCEVGKKAFPIMLSDSSGRVIRLTELAAKSKLTLLLLWRTDCSHCLEFEPELEKWYEAYRAKGLEVIGICIDAEPAKWEQHLRSRSIPWPSFFPYTAQQRNQLIQYFPVPGTPTLIAVDRNFVVKNRMVIRKNFESYLEEELGKGNPR